MKKYYGARICDLPVVCFIPLNIYLRQKVQEYIDYEYYEREREARCYLISRIFKVAIFGAPAQGERRRFCLERFTNYFDLPDHLFYGGMYNDFLGAIDYVGEHKKIRNASVIYKIQYIKNNNFSKKDDLWRAKVYWLDPIKRAKFNKGYRWISRYEPMLEAPYDLKIINHFHGYTCARCRTLSEEYYAKIMDMYGYDIDEYYQYRR